MLKLIYYVPDEHLEKTKQAVFAAGAGGIGDYAECAWQVLGKGQFKPLKGADPFIGEVGELEEIEEWRVEMIVPDEKAVDVAKALKASHPYEEPAFEFIQLLDIKV
ncbi:NGG1p interacting factor NIF3 [Acinetobacter thermotolerans]|uniref:NGG1p interacting factor NIF3 n=1 Tax=Acinetobacter thermotolerans TaxID=3151487 RepID=UPI00325AFFCD